jgi:ribosome biogenesis protein Nip4
VLSQGGVGVQPRAEMNAVYVQGCAPVAVRERLSLCGWMGSALFCQRDDDLCCIGRGDLDTESDLVLWGILIENGRRNPHEFNGFDH